MVEQAMGEQSVGERAMARQVALEGITPAPTPAEVAAIVAAVEVLWPEPVAGVEEQLAASPVWRFSGRWWRKPIAARRDRPW